MTTEATCTLGPHKAMQRTCESGTLQYMDQTVKEQLLLQLSQRFFSSMLKDEMRVMFLLYKKQKTP